jgi:hypothetical protein
MVSHMVTSYELQITQVNKEPPSKSSLDLTLMQHLRDENPEPRKVCVHLEVEPPRTWYYCISPNFHTLVILLQINPASSDEPEIIYEGYYETEDISIFACFSSRHWTLSLVARSNSSITF